MDTLPNELWSLVFSHLLPHQEARVSLVCKSWFHLMFRRHTEVRIHECFAYENKDGKSFAISFFNHGKYHGRLNFDWELFGVIYQLLGKLPLCHTLKLDIPVRGYKYPVVNNLVFPAVTTLTLTRSVSFDFGDFDWMCRCFPNVENLELRFERNVSNSLDLLKKTENLIVPGTVSSLRIEFSGPEITSSQARNDEAISFFPSVCQNPANLREIRWFGSLNILPGECFSSFTSLTYLSLRNNYDCPRTYSKETAKTFLGALRYCQETLTTVRLGELHISQDTLRSASCGKNIQCLKITHLILDREITLNEILPALCPNLKHFSNSFFLHLRNDNLETTMHALRSLELVQISVSMSFSRIVDFESQAFGNVFLSCGWCESAANRFKVYAALHLVMTTIEDAGYFEGGRNARENHHQCKCKERAVYSVKGGRYEQDPSYCQGNMFLYDKVFQPTPPPYGRVLWTRTVPEFLQLVESKFAHFGRNYH